jgi:hypothetical protein
LAGPGTPICPGSVADSKTLDLDRLRQIVDSKDFTSNIFAINIAAQSAFAKWLIPDNLAPNDL